MVIGRVSKTRGPQGLRGSNPLRGAIPTPMIDVASIIFLIEVERLRCDMDRTMGGLLSLSIHAALMDHGFRRAREEFVRDLAFIYREMGIDLFADGDVDETLRRLIDAFNEEGSAERFSYERLDGDRILLRVEGCRFADVGHPILMRMGEATCPWGVITAAVLEMKTGRRTKLETRLKDDGAETLIRLI